VLVVDLDPQSNATSSLGIDKNQVQVSTYHTLVDERPLRAIITPTAWESFDIAPASPALAGAQIELVAVEGREFLLRQAVEEVASEYRYILIDSPPSLGLLTVNALTAALNGVIVPVQCEYLALEGLSELIKTIHLVREHLNPRLTIRGMLMTMYDARTNLARQVVAEVKQYFPNRVFNTVIPRNVSLSEAPSFGKPIMDYAPRSSGAVAYQNLTVEILKTDGWRFPQEAQKEKGKQA
jgi:chromosome partitioning protein